MKNNPFEQVSVLSDLIRGLQKIDSKMQAGQFIAAWRENRRILAMLEDIKKEILKDNLDKDQSWKR